MSELVVAYWRHLELCGGDRAQRLAAGEHWWAVEAVGTVVSTAGVGEVVDLLEDLLGAPGADPVLVGAGPLEDLLTTRPEAGALVAQRCRGSEHAGRWQHATAAVWLSSHHHRQLPALAAFLSPPIDARR